MDQESNIVVVEPRIVRARVLRPYVGFEAVYEGVAATTPVSFYEISADATDPIQTLDDLAGQAGYDPHLERFVPVPFGSRVTVWIPYCVFYDGRGEQGVTVEQVYDYTFHWRIRNTEAYARQLQAGKPGRGYHSEKLAGFDEPGPLPTRVSIPACTNSIIIEQTEVAGSLQQRSNVRRERLRVLSSAADTAFLALLPDGTPAVRQQGVYDNGNSVGAPPEIGQSELYLKVDMDAAGDELLIQAQRYDAFDTPPGVVWAFAGIDAPFSNVYGANLGGIAHVQPVGSGIYLLYGSAP
jgi:hypothetical protein